MLYTWTLCSIVHQLLYFNLFKKLKLKKETMNNWTKSPPILKLYHFFRSATPYPNTEREKEEGPKYHLHKIQGL